MIKIAWKSIRNRWSTALLAVLAIAMSVALIVTVEKVRRDARNSFTQTVSGIKCSNQQLAFTSLWIGLQASSMLVPPMGKMES